MSSEEEASTLAFCLPCRASVYAQCYQNILTVCAQGAMWWKEQYPKGKVIVVSEWRSHCAAARSEIVRRALEFDATWTMWFDDDSVPPLGTVQRLFSHGKAIVAPIHRKKQPPYECPAAVVVDGKPHPVPLDGDGLKEVTYMGMHCALIHADVFRDIQKRGTFKPSEPWQNGVPFQVKPGMGEDVFFFQVAKQLGWQAYLDCGWEVDHMTEATVLERIGQYDGK